MASEEAKRKKRAYDIRYNMTQVKQKRINFNKNNKEDVELLEFLESQDNESRFVKDLLSEAKGRSGK